MEALNYIQIKTCIYINILITHACILTQNQKEHYCMEGNQK